MGFRATIATLMPLVAGCSTLVYQPLAALQRPLAIDMDRENFAGTRILLECLPKDLLSVGDAQKLCSHVGNYLQNQGAKVLQKGRESDLGSEEDGLLKSDLHVRLSARRLRSTTEWWTLPLVVLSWSAFPLVSEDTDEQRMEIRDADEFLLSDTTIQIRVVEYTGLGYPALNFVVNQLFREEEDRINDENLRAKISRDYFGNLSQAILDASMRSTALKLARSSKGGGN